MKKFILFIVIVALLVGGYFWVKRLQFGGTLLKGKIVTVHRGDLDVPITAAGRIEPAKVTKIKGKASGEVKLMPQEIGEMVAKDAIIVELDKTDEQRNVDRAQADYDRAKIALERAVIAQEEASTVGVQTAQAELKQATAKRDYSKTEYDFKSGLPAGSRSEQEVAMAKAQYDADAATVDVANAKVAQAKTAVEYADKDVATMKQNLEVAKKQLDETNQRFQETTVRAPFEGMVLRRYVEPGEIIQSGKTSLTGGTVLIELADVGDIYAVVNVDEADIGMVRELAPESARPGPPEGRAAGKIRPGKATTSEPARDEYGTPTSNAATLPQGIIDTGKQVELTVESFPNERFYGVIERIAPQSELSAAIATFKVWIRITSPNRSMLVGLLNLQVEAHFSAKSVRNAMLVSYDAFQKNPEGEGFGVYVPTDTPVHGKKYVFRPCEFGRDNGTDVQVIKGLKEGEEVYTELPQMTRKQEKQAEKED